MCIATFNHLALNPYIKLSLGLSSLLSYLTEGMDEKFVKQVHLDLRQILNGHYNIFMASEDDDEEVINHDGYLVYKGRLGKMKSLEIIKMVQSGELIEGEKVSDIFARLIYAENKFRIFYAETYCTVNRTLIEYHKLEIHFRSCLTRQNASVEMKAMAESGLLVLQYQKTVPTTVSDYHFLGLLLDPLRKDEMANFTDMTEEELRKVRSIGYKKQ
uniref:Uncharacterized protein n=1 Tax=Panagrolaimus superbus TaxID=310955 RepID=A0A914Z0P0_9BILA